MLMIETIHPSIPRYLPIVAGVLLCLLLVLSMNQWRKDWALAHQPAQHSAADTSNLSKDIAGTLSEAHLFGTSPLKEAATLPITSLPMQLTGIIKGVKVNAKSSKVIISIEGRPGKLYQTGDTLPSGVIVHKITNQEVIFDNGGHLEKLSLPRHKPDSGALVHDTTAQ